MLGLRRLIDDATDHAINAGFASVKNLKVTPQAWGYGRYVRLGSAEPWFGVDIYDWSCQQDTPLWLWFQRRYAKASTLRALEQLRQRHPPELVEYDDGIVVPVELPVGVEYDAVRDAVVARLKEIAGLIRVPGTSR